MGPGGVLQWCRAIVADKGKSGFLVSQQSYKDFVIHAEFWAETDTNSGIFVRAADPRKIGADNSYEVNIWDIRPDPIYATGGIVNYVPVPTVYKAGGRWNILEIEARGRHVTVKFNGVVTATIHNDKHASGPIEWRRVQVKPL